MCQKGASFTMLSRMRLQGSKPSRSFAMLKAGPCESGLAEEEFVWTSVAKLVRAGVELWSSVPVAWLSSSSMDRLLWQDLVPRWQDLKLLHGSMLLAGELSGDDD